MEAIIDGARGSTPGARMLMIAALMVFLVSQTLSAQPMDAQMLEAWEWTGDIELDPQNISAVGIKGDLLMIGSDEGARIQVLKRTAPGTYRARRSRRICLEVCRDKGETEIDIEGIAWGKSYVYVTGSHSRKRKTVKDTKTAGENRGRLATIAIEPDREQLFRLRLDDEGRLVEGSIERISLRNVFANDPVLARFQAIPSKENGIDIEGLAVDDQERLFIGFRGPVLRGNLTPIMVLTFDGGRFKEKRLHAELRYVNLGGRGIRGLSAFEEGFLILAGPVGDGPASYRLYRWDGEDALPGKDRPNASGHVRPLCDIPLPNDTAKAEAVGFLEHKAGTLRVLIAYDGAENGAAMVFACPM